MKKENLPQLTRLEATVHSQVQRVGYRYIVQDMARKFNVKGYVQNMPDGSVKIIAEGPKKAIEKFIKTLQIREPPIYVEHIKTKRTKPTTEFKFFLIKYGDLNKEMGEGFGTRLKYMNLSRAETKQGFQAMRTEMGQGFGSLNSEISGMRQDMNKNFQGMSKIRRNIKQSRPSSQNHPRRIHQNKKRTDSSSRQPIKACGIICKEKTQSREISAQAFEDKLTSNFHTKHITKWLTKT